MDRNTKTAGLKERAIAEFKLYWIIAVYLWVFLGLFTVYRRLITAETGTPYLHYGIAIVESMVIAKVILIGKLFDFSRRFEDRPLIVPVLYKSILFGALVLGFGLVEYLVKGWVNHQGWFGGLRELSALGAYELGARVLMLMAAFIPFFAFWEIGRVIGANRLRGMFFSRHKATGDTFRPTT